MENLGYNLATLNACLNGLAGVLLFLGWIAIRKGQPKVHQKFMASAFIVSILFLISYLTRVFKVGTTVYPGEGFDRTLYLAILATHTILAALVPFLAIRSIYLALKNRLSQHKKIARLTFPIWLYVSVTGVVIYLMLYHYAKAHV